MKYCYLLLLITSTFAQSYTCVSSDGDSEFRIELRYMDSEYPEFISYVKGGLWAHWHMDKQSPLMKTPSLYFKWYNGSATIVSYSYKTKVLKLITIDGEHPHITELECKDT